MATTSLALSPEKKLHQYVLRIWTSQKGLPSSTVHSVCQTDDGYLWIGTQDGLARFDGHSFRVFSSATHEEFGTNWIWRLKKDKKGRLWIATYNAGILRYENQRFSVLGEKDGLTGEMIRDFAFEADGVTWVATKGQGIIRIDSQDRIDRFSKKDGLCGDQVFSLLLDTQQRLWIATLDGGLCVYQNERFQSFGAQSEEGLTRVLSLASSQDGTIWVGSLFGLFRVQNDVVTKFAHPHLPQDGVRAIYEDSHENLWIGFVKTGLCVLRKNGNLECDEKGGDVGYEGVLDFYEHEDDKLFISTGKGLRFLKDGDVKTYTMEDGLPTAAVRTVLVDSKGAIWLGTTQGVVKIIDGRLVDFPQKLPLSTLSIVSSYEDRNGRLWFGTEQQGIHYIDPDGSLGKLDDSLVKEHFDAFSIVQLGDKFAFGTLGMGLKVYDGVEIKSYRAQEGLPSDIVWSMEPFDDQSILLGTSKGVALYDGEQLNSLVGADSVWDDMILAFMKGKDGVLFMGTHGAGLLIYKNRKLQRIQKKNGLLTDTIYGMAFGDDGNLWLSTAIGIVKVSEKQLDEFTRDRTQSIDARVYDTNDGMHSENCNGGRQYGLQKTATGKIVVATEIGASVIDPLNLKPEKQAPIMHVEQFLVDGKDVLEKGPLLLDDSVKSLEIHYTGITFERSERVRFRYRLHGYDSDWNQVGSRRIAYFTNLGPGEYRFEVGGANQFGPWSTENSVIRFRKKPHFTETWTFILLCGLFALALILFAVRLRLRALTLRAKELDKKVKERTQELETAHQKIVELEKETLERQMAGGFAHEIRNALASSKMLIWRILAPEGEQGVSSSMSHKISETLVTLVKKLKILLPGNDIAQVAPLIKEINEGQKKIDGYVRKTHESIERCLVVTNEILEYSQAGQIERGEDTIEIDSFLQNLKKNYDVEFGENDIELRVDSDAEVIWKGSQTHLYTIVWNLVINAVDALGERRQGNDDKNANGEMKIELLARKDEDRLTLTVSDNGPGIPSQVEGKIFDPFVSTKPEKGVGLGLSRSRKCAQLYGGELRGENRKDGPGALFTLILPLKQ